MKSNPTRTDFNEDFECGCCREWYSGDNLGGMIGIGSPASICMECYAKFNSARRDYPDKNVEELLDAARVSHALEQLPPWQKSRIRRLVLLLNNDSHRARRLLNLAGSGQISLAELLSII